MSKYLCDPGLNKECKKNGCQEFCFLTRNPEYVKIDKPKKAKKEESTEEEE